MTEPSPSQKFSLKTILKWSLFVAVLFYVIRYGYSQWSKTDLSQIHFSPGWWIAASLLYFCSWVPAACLWWMLLKQAGQSLPFYSTLRAHFCGHLGKYVPGKALSLVIRAAMLKEFHVSVSLSGILATAETLITMAAGLLVAIVLIPVVVGSGNNASLIELMPAIKSLMELDPKVQYAISGSIVFLAILATPFVSWSLQWLIRRVTAKKKTTGESSTNSIQFSPKIILFGSFLVSIGWVINGCSLGCVLIGCGVSPSSLTSLLLWTTAVAAATSLGFLVLFAPGGLGVREAILVAILQLSPQIDPSIAVIAAVLFRIISFLSEVSFSTIFYLLPGSGSGERKI